MFHMFFLSFYLLTVIFTTGSPLKLPPSVLECLLSIPPTPPIDLVYSFDIKAQSVIWLIDLVKKYSLTGIIATNTTIMKEKGEGGISGKLCLEKSRNVRRWILDETRECPDLDVIGVGGISSFKDLWDFWLAGGKAVQIYTALIYQGPAILNEIKGGIDNVLTMNEMKSVDELLKNLDKIKSPF